VTDSTIQSTRRRRLAIAALVLVVFSGGLWWITRPRFDPRLVGTWTISDSPEHGMIFRADGWFSKTHYVQSKGYNARWRTEGDQVIISYNAAHPNPLERLLCEFHYRWWRAAGGGRPMGYEHLQIIEITPDKLRVVYVSMMGSKTVMQLDRAGGPADQ
jgi:hypothetical protein